MRLHPLFVAALVGASSSSCYSRWDLAKNQPDLDYGCNGQLNWYPDCDRDGFGDPGGQLIVTECEINLGEEDVANAGCAAAEADAGRPLASNQIDCDDQATDITLNAGMCPDSIGEGTYWNPVTEVFDFLDTPSVCVRGAQVGGVEYVATCGDSPQISAAAATSACTRWGGSLVDAEAAEESDGFVGLARLRAQSDGLQALLDSLSAEGVRALWLDLSYDFEESTWSYQVEQGDVDSIPQDFLPCPGPTPTLADFVEDVNPNLVDEDTDGDGVPDAIEREVGTDPNDPADVSNQRPGERLALILREGETEWCWGAPGRFGLEVDVAYAFCQRPIPDPGRYAQRPPEDK